MKKEKLYRYLGRNGILTTHILIDGVTPINMVRLTADEGSILTNGETLSHSVIVETSEVSKWREIADKVN